MTLHEPSLGSGEESWEASSAELERRCRLGSEVTSLSHITSMEKCEHYFKLSSPIRYGIHSTIQTIPNLGSDKICFGKEIALFSKDILIKSVSKEMYNIIISTISVILNF